MLLVTEPLFIKSGIFLIKHKFQPNGAGFAGVKSNITFSAEDVSDATEVLLQTRAQGSLANWKIVLTNNEFHGQQVIE